VGCFAAWLIRNSDLNQVFNIVGMVDDAPRKQGARIDSLRVLGNTADIPALVQHDDIGLLIFAIASIDPGEKEQILDLCHRTSVPVVLMPDVLATLNAFFIPHTNSNPASPDSCHWQQWLGRLDKLIQGQDWDQMQAEVTDMRRKLADTK
jgi:FlaA1/EpsC-like NDP-sugar epimerase